MGWTAVMATGIVSVDLHDGGRSAPSLVLLAAAAVLWAALLARRAPLREPAAVAATAVLGTRAAAAGWTVAAWPLVAGAATLWAWQAPWRSPATCRSGRAFLPAVATQSIAVLLATLAAATGARALDVVALALIVAGLALYVHGLTRFELRELLRGGGDQWVAGGAPAISALACATLRPGLLGGFGTAALVLWAAAMAWLPVLAAGELLRPRPGALPTRWSTVFPLGMYAAMSSAVDRRDGVGALRVFAEAWTWVAVAAWLVVLVTAVRTRLPAPRPAGARRGRDDGAGAGAARRGASARHRPRR